MSRRPEAPAKANPRRRPATAARKRSESNDLDVLLGSSPSIAVAESGSGSSIRGFSPLSKEYAKGRGMPQPVVDAVKDMENYRISRDDLRRFLKEGGLTPRRR